MKTAIDTNILVYAEGYGDPERGLAATAVLNRLAGRIAISVQVFGELYNVLTRKARIEPATVVQRLSDWVDAATVIETRQRTLQHALRLAADHHMQIWDAIVVAAADEAGCRVLLSEEMQHGFVWGGVSILDPFREPDHPLLVSALAGLGVARRRMK